VSHTSSMEVSVQESDFEALEAACHDLGVEFVRGQTQFKQYYRKAHCDHAIRVPGNEQAFEIGLVKQDDGSYDLQSDYFGGSRGLEAKVGPEGQGLKQALARQKDIRYWQTRGFRVTQDQKTENGHIVLKLTR